MLHKPVGGDPRHHIVRVVDALPALVPEARSSRFRRSRPGGRAGGAVSRAWRDDMGRRRTEQELKSSAPVTVHAKVYADPDGRLDYSRTSRSHFMAERVGLSVVQHQRIVLLDFR